MAYNSAAFGPDDIRAELQKIISCPGFDASDRNRRFLEYVVTETLEGRSERIKAYSIATSVFGRSDTFDPQQDAIVRIEAGRMRRALEHYYLTSGINDSVRIEIPVGSYVPAFSESGAGVPCFPATDVPDVRIPTRRNANAHRPLIFVDDFKSDSDMNGCTSVSHGFARHLIVGLTRFTDLAVIGSETLRRTGQTPDVPTLRAIHGVDFVLTGAIALSADRFCAEALLIDARSGQYIWSDYVERCRGASAVIDIRNDVADGIVRAIGQPTGVIFSHSTRDSDIGQTATGTSFESVLRFRRYWQTFDRDQFESVRQGLEKAVVADPHNAEAFACLSQMYTNSSRIGYLGSAIALSPLTRALALARRAIELAPSSSRGYLALASAYWFNGQVSSALETLGTSRSLNPNDMEIAGELGLRLVLRGNWDDGVALIEEAYGGNPALQGMYRIGLSLWHFAQGQYEEALSEAWKMEMPSVVYPAIMIAISAAKLGRTKESNAAKERLLTLKPDYCDSVVRDLENWNFHPDLIELVVVGMLEAGFPCWKELGKLERAGEPFSRRGSRDLTAPR